MDLSIRVRILDSEPISFWECESVGGSGALREGTKGGSNPRANPVQYIPNSFVPVAQLEERPPPKREVDSSSLSWDTKSLRWESR